MPNVEDIINERQKTHGDFKAHAGLSQSLKMACESHSGYRELSPVQREAINMILHKIARAIVGNANHVDHWDDIQGYAKLASNELIAPEAKTVQRLGDV
jgi:hypothetical protein